MTEFVENLEAVFVLFGPVKAKRMFGGYGIYHDGLMFALVADDVLYLKADEGSIGKFIELGLQRFEYTQGDKRITMSYCMAPEEIFDDPKLAKEWAVYAFEAALRARQPKKKSRAMKK